jgi:excisionase family DNA binding protein
VRIVEATFEVRTPGDVALALGVEIADLQALIDSGVLQVLSVAGGGWITSDAAIVRAAQLRSGRAPRSRRPRTATPTVALREPRPRPQRQAPAAPLAPPPRETAPKTPARRRVPVDSRRDVQPNARLDMHAAAQRLQCDERTATRLARDGTLRATRLGREWVTTESALRDYIASTRKGTATA